MHTIVSNDIRITDPSKDIVDWVKMNLELPNPEYAKKLRMGFWTGNTPRFLCLYERDGDTLKLPFGTLRAIYPMLKDSKLEADFCLQSPVDYHAEIRLFDYQVDALQAMVKAKGGILQSPAGSGKTQIGIALINKLGRKALWLTHTQDLLRQSKQRAEQYMDKSLMGTITEGKVDIGKGITFATVQTMAKLDLQSYRNTWDVIVVDECHRVAGSPTALTMFYKVLNSLNARHKYGLSATVHRSDGMIAATFAVIGPVSYIVPDEAVSGKVMQVGIREVPTFTPVSREFLGTDGMLIYAKMVKYLCENTERNALIARCIIYEKDHPCLILSDRLEHLKTLMALLPESIRKDAVMVSGAMTSKRGKEEREQAIADMKSGRKKYLFATFALAKEGLDIPRLERLFLTTPQKDYAVITQSIGRIARTCDGKAAPVAYDFVDDIPYLKKAYRQRQTTYRKNHCYSAD